MKKCNHGGIAEQVTHPNGITKFFCCQECGQVWNAGENETPNCLVVSIRADADVTAMQGFIEDFKTEQRQDAAMVYDPCTGDDRPYPSTASHYREAQAGRAWLFNPWTGDRRTAQAVGRDVMGLKIRGDR